MQCQVDQRKLADAHEQSDEDDVPPPDGGWPDEQHRGEHHKDEPHGGEQQWGDVVQTGVDDHEVRAPDDGHDDGQDGVFGLHTPNRCSLDPESPANV